MPDSLPVRWVPDRSPAQSVWSPPSLGLALRRGFVGACPACGQGHLFNGYLRVVAACAHCAAPLGQARADDAPPYFTILIVGHLIVPAMLVWERASAPPIWLQTAVWVPLTLALTLALLRPIKGATVGLMLKLGLMKSDDEV